jgi:NADH kinase
LTRSIVLDIHDFREALDDVFKCNVTILERMRLSCTFHDSDGKQFGLSGETGEVVCYLTVIYDLLGVLSTGWQAMNEVTLHRGRSPHLNIVDIFVDGVHLTEEYVSTSYRTLSHFLSLILAR